MLISEFAKVVGKEIACKQTASGGGQVKTIHARLSAVHGFGNETSDISHIYLMRRRG